jgi:magnesium-transporting ATPase (P-type)
MNRQHLAGGGSDDLKCDTGLYAPGLSVIIRGIEEARRTFVRMMGYAYYRIAMTINIMVFIVLIMVIYQVQILTPAMIILLALLDDVPVMLIAFDNAIVSSRPSRWEMRRVLTVSSMLALLGVVQRRHWVLRVTIRRRAMWRRRSLTTSPPGSSPPGPTSHTLR